MKFCNCNKVERYEDVTYCYKKNEEGEKEIKYHVVLDYLYCPEHNLVQYLSKNVNEISKN